MMPAVSCWSMAPLVLPVTGPMARYLHEALHLSLHPQCQHFSPQKALFFNTDGLRATTGSASMRRGTLGILQRRFFSGEKKTFTVLGVETSCDDTGVAVVRSDGQLLGEALHSQTKALTQEFGGVHPSVAAEGHRKCIDQIVADALDRAGCTLQDVDVIAATVGPGLAACLEVGLTKAKRLVAETRKPFVPINHLEAHALTPRMYDHNLPFPFLILLASGGNCQLVLAESLGKYHRLGATLDDAPGEALDKAARYLGLCKDGVSGGVAIERIAKQATAPVRLVVPMTARRDCNFSFSGLKTQVMRLWDEHASAAPEVKESAVPNIAAGLQRAMFKHIASRTNRAITFSRTLCPDLSALVVSGGVASNQAFRATLQLLTDRNNMRLICPPPSLCTDNGVMIAWAGVERYRQGMGIMTDVDAVQVLRYHPRWPLGDDISEQVAELAIKV